jgi:tetratricopeptide (TPR) repeat protein
LIERRKALHERIGNAIEELYSDRLDNRLDELAHHFRRSGNAMKAIEYLRRAGERLAGLNAVRSALENFAAATDLVKNLVDPAIRDRQEAEICMVAASPIAFAFGEGSAERQRLMERAAELGSQLSDRNLQFLALVHLASIRCIRGDLLSHWPLLDEMMGIARDIGDPIMVVEAFFQRAAFELWSGDFGPALGDLERAIFNGRLSSWESGRFYWAPPEVSYAWAGFCRWFLGYPDQALATTRQAVSIAHEGHRDYFIAVQEGYLGFVHQLRGEWKEGNGILKQSLVLSEQRGFRIVAKINESFLRIGLCETSTEPAHNLLNDMIDRTNDLLQVGPVLMPFWMEFYARSLAKLGRHDDAERALEDAFDASRRGPRWFEAELHRTRGELALLRSPDCVELAERNFRDAIDLARQQSARSFELRAATSLSRLLGKQGRRDEARALLSEIYGWFSEGFNTADLKDAKALLDELSA